MVALPIVKQKRMQPAFLRATPQYHPSHSGHRRFHTSCWPWEEEELVKEGLSPNPALIRSNPDIITIPLADFPAQHNKTSVPDKVLHTYSLSYGPLNRLHTHSVIASSRSSNRSQASSSLASTAVADSTIAWSSSLWDDERGDRPSIELPPIHPYDHMKTLLSQLASTISSINNAYAHQQAALNPYNMQALNGQVHGAAAAASMAVSTTDKAMVEELQRLSHLQSQLALLHTTHIAFNRLGTEGRGLDVKKDVTMQLEHYEGIITRFHEEISTKDAVTEALKETVTKSMLNEEKLERRLKALESQLSKPSS